uniref:Uncharacterized protein n=1 Tax=Haemonchus contortus TaxID=6289 RepID=A0A7I4YH07_HAECO
MESSSVYFFRADRFAFVTHHVRHKTTLGMVVHLVVRAGRVTKFLAVFEGAPEAAVVTLSLCDTDLEKVYKYSLVLAETRVNTSYAMRFSEPPVSQQARDELCELVRQFLPLNASEGVLPLRVMNLRPTDKEWLTDRANNFDSYTIDTARAKRKMGQLFNVSCSTLAAIATMFDDRSVHWVSFTKPQGMMRPIRLDFTLQDMAHEAGWGKGRLLDFWSRERTKR